MDIENITIRMNKMCINTNNIVDLYYLAREIHEKINKKQEYYDKLYELVHLTLNEDYGVYREVCEGLSKILTKETFCDIHNDITMLIKNNYFFENNFCIYRNFISELLLITKK